MTMIVRFIEHDNPKVQSHSSLNIRLLFAPIFATSTDNFWMFPRSNHKNVVFYKQTYFLLYGKKKLLKLAFKYTYI